ncbi:MAG: GNAT family N-acetyltransferase [Clostridia bacterium]
MYRLKTVHTFTDDVLAILAECMYQPDEQKLTQLVHLYQTEKDRLFFAYHDVENRTIAVIGCKLMQQKQIEILHIAVKQADRGKGIGRQLIDKLLHLHAPSCLIAETDRDAVGFYRSSGFLIISLGERYPGVERFRCVKHWLPL